MKNVMSAALAVAVAGVAGSAAARDYVDVMGSSTVLPYAQLVAESFQNANPGLKVVVKGGGSSKGLKEFCKGAGEGTIDVANSSRKIRDKEVEECKKAGVTPVEIRFGYDGIVFAYDAKAKAMALTTEDVYKAVAAERVIDGKVVANPTKKLTDVNPALAGFDIAFFIPASNHGTREVFEVKVMEDGCEKAGDFEVFKAEAMKAGEDEKAAKKTAEKKCIAPRTDGLVTEIKGDYTETLARIDSNKQGIGVFGLAFYEANTDKLQVATVNGVKPTAAAVASGEYPVSRPLFFYVKKEHIGQIKGLTEYVEYFISDEMVGPGSDTVNYGLVPAPDSERDATREGFSAAK